MFITLTIDTHQKKKSLLGFRTKKLNPADGWKKTLNIKRRSLWQRIKSWRRSINKGGYYKLGGQVAMF
ncbi:MAG: hypothetical protein AAB373_02675 [Patescibacteria group bacterium]